ncbi:Conserved oligomeric Golgi complex subunit 3 [Gracilaria domingensis]|nr:Conserved oligomeric Golgi complex subunit 3 [Gracilaria domingensis]
MEASSRAKSHGEFLRLWERNAPLTQDQLQLCALVESQCSTFAPVSKVAVTTIDEGADSKQNDGDNVMFSYKEEDGLNGLAELSTAEDFHIGHDKMERRLEEANEPKLIETVDDALAALVKVEGDHKFVSDVVLQFKSDCEALVSERKTLGELADALRKRLTNFEELETFMAKFAGGKNSIKPTDPGFVKLLHRLDECVAYASSSTGAVAEADGYLARFLELQRRAFTSIRDLTVTVFRDTTTQVAKELREDHLNGARFRHADLTDASKEYLRFRTIAPRIKSLKTEHLFQGKGGSFEPSRRHIYAA